MTQPTFKESQHYTMIQPRLRCICRLHLDQMIKRFVPAKTSRLTTGHHTHCADLKRLKQEAGAWNKQMNRNRVEITGSSIGRLPAENSVTKGTLSSGLRPSRARPDEPNRQTTRNTRLFFHVLTHPWSSGRAPGQCQKAREIP